MFLLKLAHTSRAQVPVIKLIIFLTLTRYVRFSALDSKSGQRTRHAHLVGGIESPPKGSNNTKESTSYKIRGLYKINAMN